MVRVKRFIGLVSVLAIILLLSSCYSYQKISSVEYPYGISAKYAKLIWDDGSNPYLYLSELQVRDNSLVGMARSIPPYEVNIKKKDMVEVTLPSYVTPPDSLPGFYSIPFGNIESIRTYRYDSGATTVLTLGAVVLGVVLITGIMNNSHEPDPTPPPPDTTHYGSCPVIYTSDGESLHQAGVIYAGAVLPWLERDDYLSLLGLKPVHGIYNIKMANEIKEIQNTNLAELMVIDHPAGTQAILDKYGTCRTISAVQSPVSATSSRQENILTLLAQTDRNKYIGDTGREKPQDTDVVYLSFKRPRDADNATLVVNAKNSPWLDYTMLQFCNLFGDKYGTWYNKQAKKRADSKRDFLLEQKVPLAVYIMSDGKWKYLDYYPVAGPLASRDMAMAIDLSGVASDVVNLKLECGALFWEIDSAGMDFSGQMPVSIQTVNIARAMDERDNDVSALLAATDKSYYTMPDAGSEATLVFAAPRENPGTQRTVFLHSRGHYQIVPDGRGAPKVKYLMALARPGTMGGFSKEIFLAFRYITGQ